MHIKNNFNLLNLHELDARALELKYANSNFAFVIILPNYRTELAALESKLKHYDLMKDFKKFGNIFGEEIDVKIPKFKIEYEANLNKALQNVSVIESLSESETE